MKINELVIKWNPNNTKLLLVNPNKFQSKIIMEKLRFELKIQKM